MRHSVRMIVFQIPRQLRSEMKWIRLTSKGSEVIDALWRSSSAVWCRCSSITAWRRVSRSVRDGVHLVLRMSAVMACKSCSSLCRSIESMPAFVQTVAQDGCAESALFMAKQLPATCSVCKRGVGDRVTFSKRDKHVRQRLSHCADG